MRTSVCWSHLLKQRNFEVREDAKQMSEKKGGLFHLLVEKLLFIMKGSIPYLDTAMGFLTTRLSKSDVDNREKLRRMMRFFHCTLKEKICFGATSIDEIVTWVDTSYSVHHDINIHTGCMVSVGLGITHCRSSKQIFNTKSSTEAEIVGASDYLSYNICYVMFMHHQRYLNKYNNFSRITKAP